MSALLPVTYDHGHPLVLDPDTGELVPLADAPPRVLAAAVEQLAKDLADLRDARSAIEAELQRRMGTARTLDVGSHLVEQNRKREWEPAATWRALVDLTTAGLVAPDDADEAMPEVTARKPDGRNLNALLTRLVGEDPVAAQPLAQARSERAYVKVQRTAVEGEAPA